MLQFMNLSCVRKWEQTKRKSPQQYDNAEVSTTKMLRKQANKHGAREFIYTCCK